MANVDVRLDNIKDLGVCLDDLGVSGLAQIDAESRHYVRGRSLMQRYRQWLEQPGAKRSNRFQGVLLSVNLISRIGRECPDRESASAYFGVPESAFERRPARGEYAAWRRTRARSANRQRRRRDLRIRLVNACRLRQDWALVFATLTYAPGQYDAVFGPGSKAFQAYVRQIKRLSPLGADYCAVVERGAETGRLHIHCLWFLRSLPDAWRSDPCRFEGDTRRELAVPSATLWPHGLSNHISIRFSRTDYYGRLGHRWPWRINADGVRERFPLGGPERISAYMSKYMIKAQDEEKLRWRTRMTRGLGLENLEQALARNPDTIRTALVCREPLARMLPKGERLSPQMWRQASWRVLRKKRRDGSSNEKKSFVSALRRWRTALPDLCETPVRGRPYSERMTDWTRIRFIQESFGRATRRWGASSPSTREESREIISDWFERLMFQKRPLYEGWLITYNEEILI